LKITIKEDKLEAEVRVFDIKKNLQKERATGEELRK
jgi:hypothetical protein